MTSASELFYKWRSRSSCRTPDLGLDDPLPSSDRDPDLRRSRRRHSRRGRQEPDHHPAPAARHLCHRVSHQERESDYSGTSESGTSNISSSEAATSRVDRLRLPRNDRLPSAVLQARARLLERLRGISLTRNRQTTSSGISWDEFVVSNDLSIINSGDWEIETSNEPFESIFSTEGIQQSSLQDGSKKKPAGLSWEAFHRLQQEIYKDGDASVVTRASLECAICLERFREGDRILRLSCGHRFHPDCLEPWVLTCGDCPYCRASI